METFDQIWETSRSNLWSWTYPAVICSGIAVLAALSLIRNRLLRCSAKVVVIFGFSAAATEYSAREIREKWRIRREWAESHSDRMTDSGWEALTMDGANITLGPVFYGFQAFVLLVLAAAALTFVRSALARIRRDSRKPHVDA